MAGAGIMTAKKHARLNDSRQKCISVLGSNRLIEANLVGITALYMRNYVRLKNFRRSGEPRYSVLDGRHA